MDKPAGGLVINRLQCHSKGFQGVYRLQGGTEGPPDNLMRVGICYQRKVADTFFRFYVRDITDPYLVGAVRNHILDEVRILPIVVVRVCCLVPSSSPDMDHQAVLPEYLDERIASRHAAGLLEECADDDIELYAAKARIVFPVVLGLFHDKWLYRVLCEVVLLVFVE